ncbi:MAG TPA: chalcone isomerase family protein [Pseudomonas sp.]
MNDPTSRQRTSKAWLWLLCLLSTGALANWQEAVPEARVVGAGELRLFGFRIYSARLWSPAQPLAADTPFALELTYHRAISRDDLVAASVKEIRRLSGGAVSAAQLAEWQGQMQQAFVDVAPGAQITGVHLPGRGARFYVGQQLQHEVRDRAFAAAFFAIWLDPRTRNPELRAQLLGADAR